MFGFGKKKKAVPAQESAPKVRVKGRKKSKKRHAGPYTSEQRRQAIEAYLKGGMTPEDFAVTWGVGLKSLIRWIEVYHREGPKALDGANLSKSAKKRGRKGLPRVVKDEITAVRQENPEFGTKKVRNFLFRFRGVKVSNGTVRKTLKEANFPPAPQPRKKRRGKQKKARVQRFERALPMQLWQTDITSFLLTRHSQRVYLTVFMDDYSRYVVSWSLALAQTKEFVMETLLQGISRFGKPEEVLTDQGRQYFSWRGKSGFRKLLKKQGIQHVVARAHHPETVGKCERFWETVQAEFWDRVEPQDLNDVRARFEHFVSHYNHFRPHQGIDGMTPADRFFGSAKEIRAVIEDTISKNALRLAVGEAPRRPVFLIGQIGETPVSLHGEKGKLVVQTSDGVTRRLDYEEFGRNLIQPTTNPMKPGEAIHDELESRKSTSEVRSEGAQEAQKKPEILDAEAACVSSKGALGNGNGGAEEDSARGIDRTHGILARANYETGSFGTIENTPTSHLAAFAAGDIGNGSRVADTAQDPSAARSDEQRNSDAESTEGSRERSTSPQKEDCQARGDNRDAGTLDRGSEGDAGLQRCEDSDGGDSPECGNENDESSTDRSSS